MFEVKIGAETFKVGGAALPALAAMSGDPQPLSAAAVAQEMPMLYHVDWFIQRVGRLQKVTITRIA